ncbi:MAG: hypothetical protein M1834_008304 [Cirrosporium novae-zelandiae]|nr:MAG: hypothetical protein M1834_008304 [Cirrosporium novae-zelandiae]
MDQNRLLATSTSQADSRPPQTISDTSNGFDRVPGHPRNTSSSHNGAPVPKVRRRNRMITSCLECRRRKLKCDKSHPCANCSKFRRDCVFLASALDTASQLKLSEIKEKMGSLERVLEHDVARKNDNMAREKAPALFGQEQESDNVLVPDDEKDLDPTPLSVIDAAYGDGADDDLLDLGIKLGKLRLNERIGGYFRPKIHEELTIGLNDALLDRRSPDEKEAENFTPPQTSSDLSYLAPGPNYIAPSSNFFFGGHMQLKSLIDYLPSRSAADLLIQQYWVAVHPVVRVVHRPSFENQYETFWAEITAGIQPVASLQALVFSAMFSAVVSLPETAILNNFGVSRRKLIDNFHQGTEAALAAANFLRTSKVETLQALVMFLIPLCRNEMSRAHSALIGLTIRLAECMGLHRDPSHYGLTRLECHVRRILWAQICFLDIRTCEVQGPRPTIRKDEFDTKLPELIDDDDLLANPDCQEHPERWTDMTFARIRFECNEMHRQIWVDRPRIEKKQISLTSCVAKIEGFRKRMNQKYLPVINDSDPLQRDAHLVMELLTSRMVIMLLHRYHSMINNRLPDRLRQLILTAGTVQLESSMAVETIPELQTWAWYAGAYQQYHVAFLLLAEIFIFPTRKEADRIWACLDYIFEPPLRLTRDQKARLILREIRDRTTVYNGIRNVKAPVAMTKALGLTPPRKVADRGYPQMMSQSAPANVSDAPAIGQEFQFTGVANGEALFSSQVPDTYLNPNAVQGTALGHSPSGSSSGIETSIDELMTTIDWNEWDKLFPSEIPSGTSSGDFTMPAMTRFGNDGC